MDKKINKDKDHGRKKYVRLRLKLAEDKARVAQLLFDNAEYRDAVSKAYYAVFYAVKAFLLQHGEDPHSHKGVDILFRKYCASHPAPSETFARMLAILRQARLDADYSEDARVTRQDAREMLAMAGKFIAEIRIILK